MVRRNANQQRLPFADLAPRLDEDLPDAAGNRAFDGSRTGRELRIGLAVARRVRTGSRAFLIRLLPAGALRLESRLLAELESLDLLGVFVEEREIIVKTKRRRLDLDLRLAGKEVVAEF